MTNIQLNTEETSTADDFSFNIGFLHESVDPAVVSGALRIEPIIAWKAGDPMRDHFRNSSYWYGELFRGSEQAFEEGLNVIESTLTGQQQFCQDFIASGGEIEVTLNHKVHASLIPRESDSESAGTKTKLVELSLYPKFLQVLVVLDIGLRLQIWS